MKKRFIFKGWLVNLFLTINLICFFVLASDCEDFGLFVKSKLIALVIIIVNTLILKKHSKMFD